MARSTIERLMLSAPSRLSLDAQMFGNACAGVRCTEGSAADAARACDAPGVAAGEMVGVGVEGAAEYYGEYYPPEYYVTPDMCPHPHQHPQHAHMCTVHAEYGGMQVVPSTPMMPQLMPPVMDESMRHYLVAHPHPHHHPPHPQQHHQPPPHHQPPHHYVCVVDNYNMCGI
ncbi:unnamed protein product [Diatraea saccharalis]|uniref:Uncharacterized protein n=1 Tax=Diatraea saccharalis TaxID=40085 RepID=A0A9N9WBV0_9NEOP|nr:unnamed protein product [Diatraea saccharalis]